MASFWAELKKRKVIRAAVVYLVVAWVIVQIADVLAPVLLLPDWVARLVTFLLILGFPAAIVLAWAYDLTPDGIRTAHQVDSELDANAALPQAPDSDSEPAIAVLPFTNNSPDPDNDYFSDGIAEELLNTLSRIPGWRVAAQTSCFYFKGRDEKVTTIGAELGVTTVLEGSVRASDDRVRVSSQLINVADGYQLWSGTYTHDRTDLLQVQEDIARAIVKALKGEVFDVEDTSLVPTQNEEAYRHYLRGRFLWQRRDADAIAEGIELLRKAVSLDPEFAEAYASLAAAYHKVALYDPAIDNTTMQRLAETAAQSALGLSPGFGEASAILGSILAARHEYAAAEAAFGRALENEPDNATAQHWFGLFLMNTGRARDSLAHIERARSLDPLNGAILGTLGAVKFALGRIDAAVESFESARELGWRDAANAFLGAVHLYQGEHDVAATCLTEGRFAAEPIPAELIDTVLAAARAGTLRDGKVGEQILTLRRQESVSARLAFRLSALLGLETLFDLDVHTADLSADEIGALWLPPASELRRDDRFPGLIEGFGLPQAWRASTWADACRPDGDSFICDK
ncbi:MAG: hypothetical protein QNI96_15030 [Woeseiaceae bacterium]|nr:hypothetical protein [Woeseiaceae bacterium]